ncbi:hypothetical protein [Sphingomonas sp. LC-1]|uniref:hypothetical protein n=1 Tax=Sphingomonas sp. LC-1 TaxID=3110957 RepID=UPI0021BADC01|nr:hypothetical protein [Sphingomonas sp. LC-1]
MTFFAVVPMAGAVSSTPNRLSCSNVDPDMARTYVDRRVKKKELQLTALYPKALASVRRNYMKFGRQDNRSDPIYFQRSQDAWKKFVLNDCKLRASFGGGSNSSISDRELDCYEGALDGRIEFFKQLADGSFGAG